MNAEQGECMRRGPSGKQKIDNSAVCLCFLNFLAFLRPAADRAVSVLPWVVSRVRKYGLFWAYSMTQKNARKEDSISSFSP
jgi:hypothetical protein